MTISSTFTLSNTISNNKFASPECVVKNIQKIAIPIIVLVTTSMIQGAQAITYVECVNKCDEHRDTDAFSKLICYALCAIFAKD